MMVSLLSPCQTPRAQVRCMQQVTLSYCSPHADMTNWPLPIPRSMEVMQIPTNTLINKGEHIASCRKICGAYFLSQKGRIHELTRSNQAYFSLEL